MFGAKPYEGVIFCLNGFQIEITTISGITQHNENEPTLPRYSGEFVEKPPKMAGDNLLEGWKLARLGRARIFL
jgi:hypothetical protein